MAASLNGIVINEILADPSSAGGNNFDTDRDGVIEDSDEFVELYNTSGADVDISGWTLSDGDVSTFTFPAGTTIPAGEHIVIVTRWNSPELQPSWVYSFGPNALWNNTGDEVILSDGTNTIAAVYNAQNNNDIPAGADVDDFFTDTDGLSIQRSPDGSDTFVVAAPTPECFLTGTRILTENGDQLVEELEIGDRVQTADGKIEAVKWIGYQTINPSEILNPLRGNPVQIKAGALGENTPTRDLFISPDHALLVDGLLINAGALVNDISIVKTQPTETFVYHHIELDNHALLVAEGTFAESYMPQNEDRLVYDNGAEYEELYPHGSKLMLWPMDYPRVSSKSKVPRFVRQKLMQIAGQLEGETAQLSA